MDSKFIIDEHRMLNPKMVAKQKISDGGVKVLISLHQDINKVIEKMENTDDPTELRKLNEEWVQLQFRLQEAWKFDRNSNFHHWYTVPKCRCPKMDNEERYGTDWRIVNSECPVHGSVE